MTNLSPSQIPVLKLQGFHIYKGLLARDVQVDLVNALRAVATKAPVFTPQTAGGRRMSVQMTSAGRFGWYSDENGYRYIDRHPMGQSWPDIPDVLLNLWDVVADAPRQPDSCLINFYGQNARMGMHQDRDEADLTCPVVSVSLGDDGLLRVGGSDKGGKTDTIWLQSGDVVVMGGDARLAWHGIDKIRYGSSGLLPKGGRINVTLRVAR